MRAEFFAKIIGPRTQNLVKALGTDVVPIDPPIPVCSTQGVVFRVDANMLTDKQLVSLTNLLSREQSLTIQEVENSLATLGLGIPVEDCVLPKIAQRQIDLLRDLFRQNVAEAYHGTNKEDTVSEVLWVSIMIIM